jgi:hypothetical protein
VLSGGVWTTVGALHVGDWLTAADGHAVPVYSLRGMTEVTTVYNFQVEGGTYVADGVVVHNKDECLQYIQYCFDCPGGP